MNSGERSGIRINLRRCGRWTPRISESLRTQFISTVYTFSANGKQMRNGKEKNVWSSHQIYHPIKTTNLLLRLDVEVITPKNILDISNTQLEKLLRSWHIEKVLLYKFVRFFHNGLAVQGVHKCTNTQYIFTCQSAYWTLILLDIISPHSYSCMLM